MLASFDSIPQSSTILHGRRTRLVAVLLLIFCLAACSGGSGDGDSASAQTGVRLVHASIDLPALDLYSSAADQGLVQRTHFAGEVVYAALPIGLQELKVTTAKRPSTVHFTLPSVAVVRNERRSMVVFGDQENFALQAKLLIDGPAQLNNEAALVRVFHGAVGAAAIDVNLGSQSIAASVPYGTESAYSAVGSAPAPLIIRRNVDSKILFSAPVSLETNRSYTVFLMGDADYYSTVRVLED